MIIGTYKVRGHELLVSASLQLPSEDISGKSDSTERQDKGRKAKQLDISLLIPYKKPEWLQSLLQLAEATTDGDRVIYDIVDHTADTLRIKQASFKDNLSIQGHGTLKAWNVSFTLSEHISTAERVEKRRRAKNSDGDSSSLKATVDKVRAALK